MKSVHFSSVHKFFVFVGIVSFLCVGYGIKIFWYDGSHNIENVAKTYETAIKFKRLESYEHLKKVKRLVEQDRAREALKIVEDFNNQLKSLEGEISSDEYDRLNRSVLGIKKSLVAMISHPELKKIIRVLKTKVKGFRIFVSSNYWKRLTRNSERLEAKLESHPSKSPGFYSYRRIKGIQRNFEKDVKFMEDITTASVLKSRDKGRILERLGRLKTEIAMFGKYNKTLKNFSSNFSKLEQNYIKWHRDIGPQITTKRLKLELGSRNILFGLVGFLSFLLISVVASFYFLRRDVFKNTEERERLAVSVLKNHVLPVEVKPISDGSPEFQRDVDKFREYIHKRMSFGSVFQDAMPFSSLLLDSNLNLVWANGNFYESWNLESKKEDSLTWDYLQRFTNLGENDPILEAIQHDIAGIYQIQVKAENSKESSPFEMYVSPVEYAGQKRVMVIFYPLRNLEDTLLNQTKSLVGPVVRSLDALTENRFDSEFQEKVYTDFEVAGIDNVFSKFQKYNEFVMRQKEGLLQEIDNLEAELSDQLKLMKDIEELVDCNRQLQGVIGRDFKETKTSIVKSVEIRNSLEGLFKDNIKTAKELYREQDDLIVSSSRIQHVLEENIKAFESVLSNRDELKKVKILVDDSRTRMIRTVEQALIFNKGVDSQFEQALDKIKLEVRGFDQSLKDLNQAVGSMDICLSKVGLILEKTETPSLLEVRKRFDTYRGYIETNQYDANVLCEESEDVDESIVGNLKTMYGNFMEEKSRLNEIDELIKFSSDETPIIPDNDVRVHENRV